MSVTAEDIRRDQLLGEVVLLVGGPATARNDPKARRIFEIVRDLLAQPAEHVCCDHAREHFDDAAQAWDALAKFERQVLSLANGLRGLERTLNRRPHAGRQANIQATPSPASPITRAGEVLSESPAPLEVVGRISELFAGAEATPDELRRAGAAYAASHRGRAHGCACTGVYHHGECPMRAMTP